MTSVETDAGRFTSAVTRTYNTLGKIETETQVIDGWNSGAGRTITYAWNEKGQKTGVTYPVSADVITYTRDELDRVDTISRGGSEVVDYTFSGKRVIEKAFPGSLAQYRYDDAGRLTQVLHKDNSSGNTLAEFDDGFDRAHRITHQDKVYYDDVQNTRLLSDVSDQGEQYAYDGAGRLVTVLKGVPTAQIATAMATNITNTDYDDLVEYAYDQTGNRLTLAVDGTPTVTYAHNTVNEMTTEQAASHTYDTNGNLEGTSNARHYDYQNRLASFDNGSNTFTWHYDALGRLLQRDRTGLNRHPRNYYDGEHIVDKISYNSGNTTETLNGTYVFGDHIDELLLFVDVDANPDLLHYAHADHLGSVQLLVDGTGAIEESYRYDAWGVPTVVDSSFTKLSAGSTSEIGNVYMYTGRAYAPASAAPGEDWYYYRARHYRADAGRFVQRDPLGYVDSGDLYSYARESPVMWTDPTGKGIFSGDCHNNTSYPVSYLPEGEKPDPPPVLQPGESASCDAFFVPPGNEKVFKVSDGCDASIKEIQPPLAPGIAVDVSCYGWGLGYQLESGGYLDPAFVNKEWGWPLPPKPPAPSYPPDFVGPPAPAGAPGRN